MSEAQTLHARVFGVVQGVGFRFATINQARRRHLRGYVRNMEDGSVEVVAEGEPADLAALLTWLHKGPTGAYVRRVDHSYRAASGAYRGFDVSW